MTASPRLGPAAEEVVDGRYTIERQLGEGGMGAVYLARHNVTGRRVALKFVQSNDKSLRQRLLREARAIAKVSHPSVVDVLDAGEHRDGVYIALEFLSGKNLRDHVTGREVKPEEAVRLLMPALEGVAAAHQAGILHRDLKPENLFVCMDGEGAVFDTKVLDFGISKQVLGPDEAPKQTALTQQGHIVGTPEYMAPEQIAHDPVLDERTDVYAMGLVLYELLAGRLPYETRELRALLLDIVRGELPSPSRFRSQLPAELCKVVMRALATDPARRFDDIASFARALEPWSSGRKFEPPRKLGAAHDAAHSAKTLHRSGAVPVSRPDDTIKEPAPVAAISTVTREAPATREERSLRPGRRQADRSDAALAATMHSQEVLSAAPPALSPAPSPPLAREQRAFRITVLVLLAVIIGGLGYAWLRPRPSAPVVASQPEPALPPVASEVAKVVAPVEPVPAAKPEAIAAQPEPAPAAVAPAAAPTAAPAEAPPEPARVSTHKTRKRAVAATTPAPAPAAPAEQEPKSVEVKTRAGTFGKKDF